MAATSAPFTLHGPGDSPPIGIVPLGHWVKGYKGGSRRGESAVEVGRPSGSPKLPSTFGILMVPPLALLSSLGFKSKTGGAERCGGLGRVERMVAHCGRPAHLQWGQKGKQRPPLMYNLPLASALDKMSKSESLPQNVASMSQSTPTSACTRADPSTACNGEDPVKVEGAEKEARPPEDSYDDDGVETDGIIVGNLENSETLLEVAFQVLEAECADV